jgi:hypothetical protein
MSLFQNRSIFFGRQRLLAVAHQTYPVFCIGRKTRTKIVRILLPVLAGIFMLSCIFLVWFCKIRGTFIYFSSFCQHICYHYINASHFSQKKKKINASHIIFFQIREEAMKVRRSWFPVACELQVSLQNEILILMKIWNFLPYNSVILSRRRITSRGHVWLGVGVLGKFTR